MSVTETPREIRRGENGAVEAAPRRAGSPTGVRDRSYPPAVGNTSQPPPPPRGSMYTAGATVCLAPPVSSLRADARRRLKIGPRAAASASARRSYGRRPEPPARGPVQVHGAPKVSGSNLALLDCLCGLSRYCSAIPDRSL